MVAFFNVKSIVDTGLTMYSTNLVLRAICVPARDEPHHTK